MKLEFHANLEQKKAIHGLAYWIAELNYTKERYPDDKHGMENARKTIAECCFPECDKYSIPFWVQNCVICWAENWRNYVDCYMDSALQPKGIYL